MLFSPEGMWGMFSSCYLLTTNVWWPGALLGKCFFFLALLGGQMGFDIVPCERMGDAESLRGICKRYHYPPAPLCHHRCQAPNLLALAAIEGCLHWLASARAPTQCGGDPASRLTLAKDGANVGLWSTKGLAATAKWAHWDRPSDTRLPHVMYYLSITLGSYCSKLLPKVMAEICLKWR